MRQKTLIYVIKRIRRCEETTLLWLGERKEHKAWIARLVYRAPVAPSGSRIYIFIERGTDSNGRCVCVRLSVYMSMCAKLVPDVFKSLRKLNLRRAESEISLLDGNPGYPYRYLHISVAQIER